MRVRISTTVDESPLAAARKRLNCRDSELFDRALRALLDRLDLDQEIRAIEANPYHVDSDLQPPRQFGPIDDYNEEPPEHVRALAQKRREERSIR